MRLHDDPMIVSNLFDARRHSIVLNYEYSPHVKYRFLNQCIIHLHIEPNTACGCLFVNTPPHKTHVRPMTSSANISGCLLYLVSTRRYLACEKVSLNATFWRNIIILNGMYIKVNTPTIDITWKLGLEFNALVVTSLQNSNFLFLYITY